MPFDSATVNSLIEKAGSEHVLLNSVRHLFDTSPNALRRAAALFSDYDALAVSSGCSCERVEIRGSAILGSAILDPGMRGCLGTFKKTQASWTTHEAYVSTHDETLYLHVFNGQWVVRKKRFSSTHHRRFRWEPCLISLRDDEYSPSGPWVQMIPEPEPDYLCPALAWNWHVVSNRVRMDRLPLTVACLDTEVHVDDECCDRVSARGEAAECNGIFQKVPGVHRNGKPFFWNECHHTESVWGFRW